MCQGLSEPDLMIRESWSSAFYMGKLPEKYILLTEGLQVLSFYSSVIVLVNESGYQYGICLNVGSCYSMTKYVQAGSKADGSSLRILPDSLLHFLAELGGLAVHLPFQAKSLQ